MECVCVCVCVCVCSLMVSVLKCITGQSNSLCSKILPVPAGVVVRGCIQLKWIFLRTFNMFAHFMTGDLWIHLPTPHWLLSSFWQKQHDLMPHPPHSPDLTPSNFSFVSPDEKSPQRETFCPCGRGETKKKGRSTKRIKIDYFKNFWVVEKHLAANGKYVEGDWSLNM